MLLIKRRTALLAAAFLVLLGGTGWASIVEVKVPFPFQVRGQTLPAGEVPGVVGRVGMLLGERGTKAAMFAMTIPASGQDPKGDKPTLTFKRDETNYRLTSIWASGTEGRIITGSK